MAGTDPALPESRLVAVAAARAAAEKQGAEITVLDVRSLIVITDYFVIVSGSTSRQVKTIVDAAEEALRGLGVKPLRREGVTEGRWVLLDYVDVVVHVFGEEERRYYDLERLWKDAERLSWEDGHAASSG
ncbi:MAG TPA: ribosome silencing factor [Actinomycetota bacterium]